MNNNVSLSKRVMAYLLDICLVYFFMILVTNIRFINPSYEKLMEVTNNYSEVLEKYENDEITEEKLFEENEEYVYYATKYNISTNVILVIVIILYFGLFQKYNNGQTLGKKIMKIKVTSINDKNISLGKYILRTLPMYFIFVGSIIPLLINIILVYCLDITMFSFVNTLVVYLFFGLAIISYVMVNIRQDKRGLHDLISSTIVINE